MGRQSYPINSKITKMKANISLDGLLKFILSRSTEKEESEFISKEKVLQGIDTGLREMQDRKRSGKKAKTLSELINEL